MKSPESTAQSTPSPFPTPPPAPDSQRLAIAAQILAAQVTARGPLSLQQVPDGNRRIMARTALNFADILIELSQVPDESSSA